MFTSRWRSPVLLSLCSLVLLNAGIASAFSSKAMKNNDPDPASNNGPVVDPAPVVDPGPVASSLPPLVAAPADVVRIVSVNGAYDPNRANTLSVQPGDMVSLSADLLDSNNSYQAEGQPVEDFNWSADDSSSDVCSGQDQSDCLGNSNFQFTNYGVNFYVPYNIGQQITISVTSTLGNDGTDTITLVNASYQAAPAPVQVVTDPTQYPGNTFDPDSAVDAQGVWVTMDGIRYWSPYTYQTDSSEEWVPYRNGYWNWSDGYGYTWVSYDPWGWATDHYGVWRHHNTYGWLWRPFDDRHYEPEAVAWFDNDGNIGWYPYLNTWDEGYRQRDELGFDDGFWLGYDVRRNYGLAGYAYHPGFSVCGYPDFRNANIHDVLLYRGYGFDQRVIDVAGEGRFGRYPGEFNDYNSSRPYLEGRAGGALGEIQTTEIRSRGGAEIYRPEPAHPVPPVYGEVSRSFNPNNHTPIGTVYGVNNNGARAYPPSSNGRGLSNPPRITGPQGPTAMPPRAQHPLQPGQGNPITGHQPVSAPVNRPQPPQGGPVYHPQPVQPQPVRPQPVQPQPVRPQPVQPQPVRPQPVQPQPVRPQPVQPQPVRPQPVQPQPVRPQPVQPQPVRPQPVQPQPVRPQPVQPQPVRPQPVQPQPVRPQPVQPQPVRPQPVQPQPVRPQPVQPQPVRPQPVQPQPVRPQPVQPQPVRPQPQPQPQPRPQPQPQPGNGGGRPGPGPHR
jgi:hypothetical protein